MPDEYYVLQIQKGVNVKENLEILYTRLYRSIKYLASIYADENDQEDLEQEAYFGLIQAVDKWNPEKGASFNTFAHYYIKTCCRRYVNDNIPIPEYVTSKDKEIRKRLRTKSLDEVVFEDDSGYDTLLGDIIEDPDNQVEELIGDIEQQELKEKLWELVDSLGDRESEVLHNRYQYGLTLAKCGEKMNMCPESVRLTQKKALDEMRSPKKVKALSPYMIDRIDSYAYSMSGFSAFKNTNTSSVERAVIKLFDK